MKTPFPIFARPVKTGVQLEITVAPKSSRNSILGEHQGRLKIALTAPPVDGKANEALIAFLSKLLDVPKRDISILRGEANKHKAVLIAGTQHPEFLNNLLAATKLKKKLD